MKKIIIIGSGIIGASCAYQLASKNIQVTVVDANIDGRATSAAAGIICPWVSKRRNKAWYILARNGAAYYHELIHNLANDGYESTSYEKVGAIRLHEKQDYIKELKELAISRRESAPEIGNVQLLQPEEVQACFPYIEDPFYGLWIEGAARVDGALFRDTMLSAAKNKGVHVIEEHAQLHQSGKDIDGIIIKGGFLKADQIIATNGVWMNELFAPLHINLNIQAQKGEVVHLQVDDHDTGDFPVIMPPNNQYILSFNKGKIVIGGSHQDVKTFDTRTTFEGTQYMLNQASQIAPGLKSSAIVESRAGFRPFTFNHLPVFGSIPGLENVFIANGLGASGLTTGPYIGKQLAQLVLGEPTDIPITPYDVGQLL